MKNLANCTPREFLKQTIRIKKVAEKWVKDIDLVAIRQKKPTLHILSPAMTDEERKRLFEENRKITQEQGLKNFSELFDNAFEKFPDETLELLALSCFIEPENVDDYKVADYLTAFNEMLQNKAVMDFLLLLLSLGQTNISTLAKR